MHKLQSVSNLEEALKKAEGDYHYQDNLTKILDGITGDFSEKTLLEIILWKTNRYPVITDGLLKSINDLRKSYSVEKAKEVLKKLLDSHGFGLPMASTVLRFAVPGELQIIDQRVYRFITDNDCLDIPTNIDEQVELYFNYINLLKKLCRDYNIIFLKADRILYRLDKTLNKDIKLKTS